MSFSEQKYFPQPSFLTKFSTTIQSFLKKELPDGKPSQAYNFSIFNKIQTLSCNTYAFSKLIDYKMIFLQDYDSLERIFFHGHLYLSFLLIFLFWCTCEFSLEDKSCGILWHTVVCCAQSLIPTEEMPQPLVPRSMDPDHSALFGLTSFYREIRFN